jgi:hypothetical protein
MPESEETPNSFPWVPLVGSIVVVTGILHFLPQITSSRPGGGDPKLADTAFEPQAVEARLWQDPLSVAMADAQANREKPKGGKAHEIADFQQLLIEKLYSGNANPSPAGEGRAEIGNAWTLVAVMIPGGPYVEDGERRLRARRALIAALGSAGYEPEKDHELAYFNVPWQPLGQNSSEAISMLEERRSLDEQARPRAAAQNGITPLRQEATEVDASRLLFPYSQIGIAPLRRRSICNNIPSLLVPYEWYHIGPVSAPDAVPIVLVLWLNDNAFLDAPLARLSDLLSWFALQHREGFADVNLPLPRSYVFGPDNSGTLRNLISEANTPAWDYETRRCLSMTHIYSSQASVAENQLLLGIPGASSKAFIEERLKRGLPQSMFTFDRTLPLDDSIVVKLRKELVARNVTSQSAVALISEQDTYYARALSATFAQPTSDARSFKIDLYTYLRGIDGKLPSDEKDKEEKPSSDKADKSEQTASKPSEQTEGLNRADDIRRLARELQKRDTPDNPLRAVGLLGSDVYDKLELLKALHPAFPEAVFFTNNLDARLAHPDEWVETHNLVIASPYDLFLTGGSTVPPFRDSAQTALYAAILSAVRDHKPPPVPQPVVLEVGRNGFKNPADSPKTQCEFFQSGLIILSAIGIGSALMAWIWVISRAVPRSNYMENGNCAYDI